MSLLFMDSFDQGIPLSEKWDAVGPDNALRNNGTARTGLYNLQINSGAFGPSKVVAQTSEMLAACAWFSTDPGDIINIGNEGIGGGGISQQGVCVEATCNGDGSVTVRRGQSAGGAVIGTSASLLMTFGTYNYVALQAEISASARVRLYINGVLAVDVSGADTRNMHNPARLYADTVELMGPGGIPGACYIDDVFILDCTVAPNDAYPGGAPRIYAVAPFADGAPIAWTPLTGPDHYTEVDEIPPDDLTSYVFSQAVGAVDQYQYDLGTVPAGATVVGAQHNLVMNLDVGAVQVGSNVGGVSSAGVPLTTAFKNYPFPYDVNPLTGIAWVAADFPAEFGPEVTA